MVTLHADGGRRHAEWRLLAAGIAVSVVMLVAPVAIPAGAGLIVWSGILLGRHRHRHAGALIATIAIVSMTILVVGAVGVATILSVSTPDSGITLIQG